jgi:hypothetical protein
MLAENNKSVADILAGGVAAGKVRDHVGDTLMLNDVTEVHTPSGEGVQIYGTRQDGEELVLWAPSVIARQAVELRDEGVLPARVVITKVTSANGREYFRLEDADA